jgi:hypothetical protein
MEWLSAWLNGTSLHEAALNQSGWIVPGAQTVHILAIAALFGSGLVLALRMAGLAGMDWSPARWSQRLSGWVAGALLVLLLTGSILVLVEPERALLNYNFQLKMGLVSLAALLSWLLARRMGQLEHKPVLAVDVALAFLLLALWLLIIAAGRWIGYT